jgi:hypothetical protein
MIVIVAAVIIEAPQVDKSLRGSEEKSWTFIEPQIFQVRFLHANLILRK